ncbi:retrovirus-related pol polyprotein from transposon TNT 1-94 [Tanacetum coccineum]
MYPFERCMKVIKGHVRNKNRPEGCIAEETIAEETIEFFSEYHKTMKTIGIPHDKHVTNENEDGKPLSAGKSSEVSGEVFQKAHLYVIQNTDEIVPYIERHKQVLKTKNPGKRIALLENEHSKSFAKWLREEFEAMENQEEVHDSWLAAKDARRGKQGRLDGLNEMINDALEEIEKLETNVEILKGAAGVV